MRLFDKIPLWVPLTASAALSIVFIAAYGAAEYRRGYKVGYDAGIHIGFRDGTAFANKKNPKLVELGKRLCIMEFMQESRTWEDLRAKPRP